jgi:hypothetical protein
VTRLRIFFLFAALLALATAFAACGGGGDSDGDGTPEAILDDATLQGVESAKLDLSLAIDAKGSEGGTVDISLSGPFQSEGEGQLPRLDLSASANGSITGEDIDFEGGLVLMPGRAYVSYQGVDYEVDPVTFSLVKSIIEEGQEGEGDDESASVTACQEAFGELKVGDFADNLANDGSADVGGTSTTKVSGDLDAPRALDSLVELAETPACKSQLGGAGPLPSKGEIDKAKGQVERAVKKAHVDVYVGDDDIVRRIAAQLAIEPEGSGSGPESADVDFDLTLTGVNEDQSITAPAKTKPLSDLFLKLGVNPVELLELLEGEGGLGGLLNQLGSGGGSGGQSYAECLQGARTAADIQKCGSLLK